MASKKIQGITIEINGDTKKLNDALKDVDKQVYGLNSDLKSLNQALKLDPKNTELLAQKYDVLKRNIESTKERLETLKTAQQQMGNYSKLTDDQKKSYNALSVEIAKTESALKSLTKEYNSFGNAATQQLKKVGEDFQKQGDKIASAGASMTKGITAPITGVMALGVSYNAQMEKYQTALTTLVGSSEKASDIMEQIKQDAAKTPFDVAGLTQANQLLLSTGLSAEESRETILALGDAVSATGGGNEELSRMAVNLQQIKNVGKASALDIKQFALAGIDIYGLLANYLGVTKKEAAEMEITWDSLNGALLAASKEGGKYFQAMEKQSETFNGKLSNLKESISVLTGNLAEALMPILENIMNKVTEFMNWFNQLDPSLQDLISNILLFVAAIGPVIIIIGKIISGIGTILSIMPKIVQIIELIKTATSGLFTLITTHPIIAVITGIIAAITLLWNNCEWFRDGVTNLVKGIFQTITNIFSAIGKTFENIAKNVGENFTKFANGLIEGGKKALEFFIQLPFKATQWVMDFINKVKNAFVNIISNTNWGELGSNIVKGILNGFVNIGQFIWNAVTNVKNAVVNGFKSIFGIHSPSRLMRDEVGTFIGEGVTDGIVEGLEDTEKEVNNAMRQLASGIETSVNPIINPTANTNPLYINIDKFYNKREQDVQSLAQELEYYRKNSSLATGGQ